MTSQKNPHESRPIRGNLSIMIRACQIWPLSFTLTRERLQCDIFQEYFLLLVPCFCLVCHLSGKPSQNLAGAIAGFIDLAFCMVFSTQTTCHLLAEQGTPPHWLTPVKYLQISNLASYMLKICNLCAAGSISRRPADVLP